MSTTPCKTCGKPTTYAGTKLCDSCWNVERNLADYLKSPGGQAFARKAMPLLDDWANGHPDAWDYEAVLTANGVTVEWCHELTSDGVTFTEAPPDLQGWDLLWKHGCMNIGQTTRIIARKAAALYVSLWLRGVSASFADKLMDGYIVFLERQESTSLTFLAEIDHYEETGIPYLRLTRKGFCDREELDDNAEAKIIEALAPTPDEEIIVTFTKRKQ